MKTNEQIIKEFREKFGQFNFSQGHLDKSDTYYTSEEVESFIIQVRTDTINEIRKEVERFIISEDLEEKLNIDTGGKTTDIIIARNNICNHIKTFLNKIDK